MKNIIRIISALAIACVFAVSCGSLNKIHNVSDYNNGRQTASVLTSLAKQYASAGRLDLTNASNILNLATLSESISVLNTDSHQTAVDFGKGMSSMLTNVSADKITAVVSTLQTLSGLNLKDMMNSLQRGKGATDQTSQLVSGLESVLELIK